MRPALPGRPLRAPRRSGSQTLPPRSAARSCASARRPGFRCGAGAEAEAGSPPPRGVGGSRAPLRDGAVGQRRPLVAGTEGLTAGLPARRRLGWLRLPFDRWHVPFPPQGNSSFLRRGGSPRPAGTDRGARRRVRSRPLRAGW